VVATPSARQIANLIPFGDTPEGRARASEMGKRSAEARRVKKELERREALANPAKAKTAKLTVKLLSDVVAKHRDTDLPELTRACVCELIERLATGEVQLKSGADLAAALQVVHAVGQLQSGNPTSIGLNVGATMSQEGVLARIQHLRAELSAPGSAEVSPPQPA
jgi:hypothetical protein